MNLYDLVLNQYNESLKTCSLDNNVNGYFQYPKNEIIIHYPIRLDNGKLK